MKKLLLIMMTALLIAECSALPFSIEIGESSRIDGAWSINIAPAEETSSSSSSILDSYWYNTTLGLIPTLVINTTLYPNRIQVETVNATDSVGSYGYFNQLLSQDRVAMFMTMQDMVQFNMDINASKNVNASNIYAVNINATGTTGTINSKTVNTSYINATTGRIITLTTTTGTISTLTSTTGTITTGRITGLNVTRYLNTTNLTVFLKADFNGTANFKSINSSEPANFSNLTIMGHSYLKFLNNTNGILWAMGIPTTDSGLAQPQDRICIGVDDFSEKPRICLRNGTSDVYADFDGSFFWNEGMNINADGLNDIKNLSMTISGAVQFPISGDEDWWIKVSGLDIGLKLDIPNMKWKWGYLDRYMFNQTIDATDSGLDTTEMVNAVCSGNLTIDKDSMFSGTANFSGQSNFSDLVIGRTEWNASYPSYPEGITWIYKHQGTDDMGLYFTGSAWSFSYSNASMWNITTAGNMKVKRGVNAYWGMNISKDTNTTNAIIYNQTTAFLVNMTELNATYYVKIQPNTTAYSCDGGTIGIIYYDNTLGGHYGCNGTGWFRMY